MPTKKRTVLFAIAVIAILIVGLYLVIVNPTTAVFTQISLTQVGSGSYSVKVANNETFTLNYVNLTLKFSLPNGLDPVRLQFDLRSPQGSPILVGTGENLAIVNLTYSSFTYPHWLIYLPKLSSDAFNADVTNPDGVTVGGNLPCNSSTECPTQNNGDSAIESGATITLTFPDSLNSTQGYVFTAVYQNAFGSITNLTLG